MAVATREARPAEIPRTSCPICGGTDGPVVWEEAGGAGRACPCGVICLEPLPAEIDFTVEGHAEGYYRHAARFRLDHVRRSKPGGRLIEVGCGTGWFLQHARSAGYEVEGLEPHPARARLARERRGLRVTEAFVEEAELRPEYDVVFNVDLLSHFPDPVRALRVMARALRPDGIICLEVGTVAGLRPFWYRLGGGLGFPHHRWLYTRSGLEALFDKAGLEVCELRRFSLLPSVFLVALRRWCWPLAGRFIDGKVGETGEQGRLHSIYDWLQAMLRYRLGRWAPNFGQQTSLITLRSRSG